MLDNDGAVDIEEFESLYNSIKDENNSAAIGSRRVNHDNNEDMEKICYRNLLNKCK